MCYECSLNVLYNVAILGSCFGNNWRIFHDSEMEVVFLLSGGDSRIHMFREVCAICSSSVLYIARCCFISYYTVSHKKCPPVQIAVIPQRFVSLVWNFSHVNSKTHKKLIYPFKEIPIKSVLLGFKLHHWKYKFSALAASIMFSSF